MRFPKLLWGRLSRPNRAGPRTQEHSLLSFRGLKNWVDKAEDLDADR